MITGSTIDDSNKKSDNPKKTDINADDSNLEKKKKEINNEAVEEEKPIDWAQLLKDVLNFLLKLIIIFIIGSRVVFACRVAEANMLPTDIDCWPYTPVKKGEESPDYETKTPKANIDVTYLYNEDKDAYFSYSTKIGFEINRKSTTNYFINKIRTIENDPHVGSLVKYICVVVKNLFVIYFGATSALFNMMNLGLNESSIILLGPYLLKYILTSIYFIGLIITAVVGIINLKWLLKTNKNNDKEYSHKDPEKPVWRGT